MYLLMILKIYLVTLNLYPNPLLLEKILKKLLFDNDLTSLVPIVNDF